MNIRVKRVYEAPEPADGARFLVDRLWPRGLTRKAIALDGWIRDAAPSDQLRRWFAHDPARWEQFRRRYLQELQQRVHTFQPLLEAARHGPVTLLYSARDPVHNQAVVLRDFLMSLFAPESLVRPRGPLATRTSRARPPHSGTGRDLGKKTVGPRLRPAGNQS